MTDPQFPPFRPQRLLSNAHAQTLAAVLLPVPRLNDSAQRHRVRLADGDQIVLHDDCPDTWKASDRVALLLHGLAGCSQSGYMIRITSKLHDRGVRVFRMDHRGCGAGSSLARRPYHAGATDDVLAALEAIQNLAPRSRLSLVGFSLSGNIVLKLLGESGSRLPSTVTSAIAVCPPVDLHASSEAMQRFPNSLYARHFVRQLMRQVRLKQRNGHETADVRFRGKVRRLRDFDDQYTAPLAGYAGVDDYYSQASAAPTLASIAIPTTILASRDDPMIPIGSLEQARLSPSTQRVITDQGGHLGFLARANGDPDRYWMDWRVVEWVTRFPTDRNDSGRTNTS